MCVFSHILRIMQPELLTSADVAARFGVAVWTVNRWVQEGRLEAAFRYPTNRGPRLFDPAEVDRLAAARSAS